MVSSNIILIAMLLLCVFLSVLFLIYELSSNKLNIFINYLIGIIHEKNCYSSVVKAIHVVQEC